MRLIHMQMFVILAVVDVKEGSKQGRAGSRSSLPSQTCPPLLGDLSIAVAVKGVQAMVLRVREHHVRGGFHFVIVSRTSWSCWP